MSKLEVVKTKKIQHKCRGEQNHYSIHSPKHVVEFCKKCNAYTEVMDKNKCRCCGTKVIKKQKKEWLVRVMKTGVRQHHNIIRDWTMFPTGCQIEEIHPKWKTDLSGNRYRVRQVFAKKPKRSESQYVEIKYKGTVYEIQIKYLALYLESINEDEKMEIIKKKLSIKGYRIMYDEIEEMEERCVACKSKLNFDLEGRIFCPECNGAYK